VVVARIVCIEYRNLLYILLHACDNVFCFASYRTDWDTDSTTSVRLYICAFKCEVFVKKARFFVVHAVHVLSFIFSPLSCI